MSQNNGVTESDSESDDHPSGAVDEGEQPVANEPELTTDIEEAERSFTECVAANTRLVDTSEFNRATIAYGPIEKARLAQIATRYNHHPVYSVHLHVLTYDRERILAEARSRGVPAKQVFAFASLHELRHAYDAKRCASYVNLKGIDFDCEPLATSAYVTQQNTTGLEYERWTDRRAAEDYFTAFRTPAYRGDPVGREYDPDGHPECLQD